MLDLFCCRKAKEVHVIEIVIGKGVPEEMEEIQENVPVVVNVAESLEVVTKTARVVTRKRHIKKIKKRMNTVIEDILIEVFRDLILTNTKIIEHSSLGNIETFFIRKNALTSI